MVEAVNRAAYRARSNLAGEFVSQGRLARCIHTVDPHTKRSRSGPGYQIHKMREKLRSVHQPVIACGPTTVKDTSLDHDDLKQVIIAAVATFPRDLQYVKFSAYGFLKNLRFFEPFMVLFLLDKGISYIEIGTLYAIREIAINATEVPSGAMADILGRRRTMIASFIAYLASFILFWTGSSLAVFIPAMILFAFGDAFRTGTHKAMILTYLRLNGIDSYKGEYYGHTRGWSQMGSAVSAAVAAAIVFGYRNYNAVFLYSTIPYALDLLLLISYPKELDGEAHQRSGSVRESVRALGRFLKMTATNRMARRAVVSSSLYSGVYKGTKDFLQPMIVALALTVPMFPSLPVDQREAILVGLVYSLLFLITSWSSRKSSSVARWFTSEAAALNWILIVGIVFAIAVGVTAALGVSVVPVVLFFMIFVVQNVRRPIGVSVISDSVPEGALATVLSVESQTQSIFAALFAFAVGAIAQAFSNNVGVGIVAVAAVVLLAVPAVWIPRVSSVEPDRNPE